ncbi:hypothetical protein A6681_07015 [Pseudomonas aeruginosa]|nr:hypothetical protein AM599_07015 [Pseudomonas aeruginosa]AON11670.1 hypothetical protein A6681_07015 [Pseudomonas aeruginosa]AON17658.1 hypothetical protein A7331_07010 [Pseudomonas aeruginosa]AON24180.1 hypothetical protein A6688_09735 [Pseudomonas aeruginosa]AON29653.1 hypothetical protein A6695_07015 [Pseudomonas aeruginosa]
MTAARGAAGYKLGFAVEDDDKAASVGLEALDLLGGGGTGRVDVYRGGTLHGVTSSLWWRVEVKLQFVLLAGQQFCL